MKFMFPYAVNVKLNMDETRKREWETWREYKREKTQPLNELAKSKELLSYA